jgi:hypothetical protein
MARGWESKDVENQQILREESRTINREKSPLEVEIDSLQLQRTRVLHSLQSACHPNHRAQLQASLVFLEDRIRQLSSR